MNDRTIIEAIWKKVMAEFDDSTSIYSSKIPTKAIRNIDAMPPSVHGELRAINIGVLTPSEIDKLIISDIIFYAPNGVEDGGEYPCVFLYSFLNGNFDNALKEEDSDEDSWSEDYDYELRAEAFARGGMQAVNDMSYSHDFGDCDMCGGHGCDRCDW